MNKDKIDKYVDELNKRFEEIENTLQFLSYAYLLKNYKQPQFWQKNQRQLLKGKDYLERDYDRETNEILVNDLGYRFNKALTKK